MMHNRNRWYLQDSNALILVYEFPLSDKFDSLENNAYYFLMLREVLLIGESSGLLKLHSLDLSTQSTLLGNMIETYLEQKRSKWENWLDFSYDKLGMLYSYSRKEDDYYFSHTFTVYNEYGNLIDIEFNNNNRRELFKHIKPLGKFHGTMFCGYFGFQNERETILKNGRKFQFRFETETNIWFPFGGFDHSHACRFNNNELARLNCQRLDAFMKGMCDLTKRYEGVFWKENLLGPSIANNFIDPEGINWQEFERQCQLYEYPLPDQDYIAVNYEANMHFHPDGTLIVHYFSTLDLDSPEYLNTYKAYRHKFAFSIPMEESFKSVNSLQIFSLWGVLLTTLRDLPVHDDKAGWDGKLDGLPAPSGTYNFIAEVECTDGAIERHLGQVHVSIPI